VPGEKAEHLFEPFYTTKSGGMGMGLSICRSIVEAHGGRLSVNANLPRGAVFQFTVPVHDDERTSHDTTSRIASGWKSSSL
jgi:signal transduction histidine kinase